MWKFLAGLLLSFVSSEPNPPTWPTNVYVFDPADASNTQQVVDKVYSQQGGHNPPFNGQWSNSRYAFLFKPGTHNVDVNVGYYTSVIGLGRTPQDTSIAAITCENGDYDYTGGALANFWRSVENVFVPTNMLWAVSQASPLRQVSIAGNLDLYQYNSGCCAGYASGGYLGNSRVGGTITSGSQQQWFTRNTNINTWSGGVWNMVFVGNSGNVPGSHCGHDGGGPYTTVTQTPVIAEKPYIIIDSTGKFSLVIPPVENNKVGQTSNWNAGTTVDFANVYVAKESDSAATINGKLSSGLHVILSPGNYNLDASINITRANTAVVGIGFPTLISTNGQPAIVVQNVDGVRVSGILLQAGQQKTSSLLQWGTGSYAGSASNPGFLYDCFARVGGTNDPSQYQVQADTMVIINSGNVHIDNAWLWRADHDVSNSGIVVNSQNPNLHGLVVNGANVYTYGLAVEHQLQDLVQWNGANGRTYFYQSELPYDVTEANFGTPNYVGFRVTGSAHQAWGAGVYSYFRDNAVTTVNGIVTPSDAKFQNSFSCFLNGLGQITHVINNNGAAVNKPGTQTYVC